MAGIPHPFSAAVRDLWIRAALVLGPSTTLSETARALRANDVSAAVVGVPGAPVAIVTERDLTRALAEGRSPSTAVEEVATHDPVTVTPDAEVREAATTMLLAGLRHLVVAQDHKVIGVISMRDVLAALVTSETASTVVIRLDRVGVLPGEGRRA